MGNPLTSLVRPVPGQPDLIARHFGGVESGEGEQPGVSAAAHFQEGKEEEEEKETGLGDQEGTHASTEKGEGEMSLLFFLFSRF